MSLIPPTRRLRSHGVKVKLPWDCLALICKQCDPATLAVLGRVSLDFLRATSLYLYRHIHLESFKALERLFSERLKRDSSSRVDPALSLGQIETLHLDLSHGPSTFPLLGAMSLSRSPEGIALPLHDVSVTLVAHRLLQRMDNEVFEALYSKLFPLVNPAQAHWELRDRTHDSAWTPMDSVISNPIDSRNQQRPLLSWDRLQLLNLRGTMPYLTGRSPAIFGLSAPDLTRRRVVHLHNTMLQSRWDPDVATLLEYLVTLESQLGLDGMQPRSVVFGAPSPEVKTNMEALIQAKASDKHKSIFVVEVEI